MFYQLFVSGAEEQISKILKEFDFTISKENGSVELKRLNFKSEEMRNIALKDLDEADMPAFKSRFYAIMFYNLDSIE